MAASSAVRRAMLTLFSLGNCCHCHRSRLVLAEKGLDAEVVYVSAANPPAEFVEAVPGRQLPALIDRELLVYNDRVIIEYLDERYPHPGLLASDPAGRARQRMALHRLETDLYGCLPRLSRQDKDEREAARNMLERHLLAAAEVISAKPFFLGDSFSLLDATLAPILWRLSHYGIELPAAARAVLDYAGRMFVRPAFQRSLSPVEREMNDLGSMPTSAE